MRFWTARAVARSAIGGSGVSMGVRRSDSSHFCREPAARILLKCIAMTCPSIATQSHFLFALERRGKSLTLEATGLIDGRNLVVTCRQHEFGHVSEMITEPGALGVMPDPVGEFDDFGEAA